MLVAARLRFLILVTITVAADCSRNAPAHLSAKDQVWEASARIIEVEIARASARTAFEVIQQLRPQYLLMALPHDAVDGPVVYVDGIRVGGVEALSDIAASIVGEIRRLDPTEATIRFGNGHAAGAILVVTKR